MRGGMLEFLVIIGVVFVLFGSTIIPKIVKSAKASKQALKDGVEELKSDEETK